MYSKIVLPFVGYSCPFPKSDVMLSKILKLLSSISTHCVARDHNLTRKIILFRRGWDREDVEMAEGERQG